jgi:AAA domain-containing protein
MLIRKAERKKAKLRLGLSGASGSGKTWSALEIATGMGGKIGMIDTEAGRGELYGNDFQYDIIRLDAPYSPERYIEAMKMFEKAGYDILIIDSLSHAWVGDGGVLSIVDKAGSNSFTQGWKVGTPKQNALIDALVTSKMHVITTFRAKTEYAMEKNERGKMEPHKIGLAPVQRDGIEYEYTVFMNMNQDHIVHVSKDNTKMFDQQYIKPTQEMGAHFMRWLNTGVDVIDMRDNFINVVLPDGLEALLQCESIDALQREFLDFTRQYAKEFPEFRDAYIAAKDQRKEELTLEKSDIPVIQTVSKHSQTLTHLAQGIA